MTRAAVVVADVAVAVVAVLTSHQFNILLALKLTIIGAVLIGGWPLLCCATTCLNCSLWLALHLVAG